jgi:hypothetical protein
MDTWRLMALLFFTTAAFQLRGANETAASANCGVNNTRCDL